MQIISFISNILTYQYKLKLLFYKIIYSHVKWGKHINLKGFPIFRFLGAVTIGNHITLVSKTQYNFVGLTKPCSICVARNATLLIGDYSGFSGVSIFCLKYISIGKYCNIGGNVSIWDTDFHSLSMKERREHNGCNVKSAPVIIEDDAFIGANSIILKGVIVGKGAIIGAGSVVTKNIPSGEVWAGNPARFIGKNENFEAGKE